MTKAVFLSLGFFLLAATVPVSAQTAPATIAANEALLRQAKTIELRRKLEEAKGAVARGDLTGAAQLYDQAYTLVTQIGSGIDAETAATVAGLTSTRLELARQAQRRGDLHEAQTQIARVLAVNPKDPNALALKRQNDQLLEAMRGRMPDAATLERMPQIKEEKIQAGTLVQDGKMLYEAGKFEEAEVKLNQALQLDPDNQAAVYYLNLVKQANYARAEQTRTTEAQDAMVQVEKEWTPKVGIGLPVPNPYATNTDVHTGAGREAIYRKLNTIHIDNIPWGDGIPLNEALNYLQKESQLRDPDKMGINFLFNPNVTPSSAFTTGQPGQFGGPGGFGAPGGEGVQLNPATGLPAAPGAPGAGASAQPETLDPSTVTIRMSLRDVRLADVLNAMVMVADHPIKYSVEDWGIVFSGKPNGPEPPTLEMRVFKVDPNTFYQGLQSVAAFNFASVNTTASGGVGGVGGGGGGGQNGNQVSGAAVPQVNIAPGTGQARYGSQNGGGGFTGGGAGGVNGGVGTVVGAAAGGQAGVGGAGGAAAGAGPLGAGEGVAYLTLPGYMSAVNDAVMNFFAAIGVNLRATGRSVAFNDRLGLLFVKATPEELDTIERTIQALNQVAPQVHIKARFIELQQDDNAALGFDWYLGNFINGSVVASGGSQPSLFNGNPTTSGYFPGETPAGIIPGSANDQLVTGGLRNTGPALATVTGILTDPNFRVVIHALEQRTGVETLAEPEVVTTSGRQTQMRATDIKYIITGYSFQQAVAGVGAVGATATGTQ
jgi:tetratricopeptide (TPR) repeat protein